MSENRGLSPIVPPDQLITAWADTSGMAKTLEERAAGKYPIQYEAFGPIFPGQAGTLWDTETIKSRSLLGEAASDAVFEMEVAA